MQVNHLEATLEEPRQKPITGEQIIAVHRHLTDRDLNLIDALGQHQVLLLPQITRMFFPSETRARTRLTVLRGLGVVTRFRRSVRPGSQAWRYTLGHVGATIYAHSRGEKPPRVPDTTARLGKLTARRDMEHLLGVNEVLSHLYEHARHTEGAELEECLGEPDSVALTYGFARPDASWVWREGGLSRRFFLEYNTGTESLVRVVRKLRLYDTPLDHEGVVVFVFPNATREANFRFMASDAEQGITVATTSQSFVPISAGRIWWPLAGNERSRLVDFGQP
ncbi:hypothetical protein Afil01_15160 [Actinorhabdospora filicis]|uniref:Protein involved in plasmid replication-relaxation n=1 Tax=Actinorhabdospora filicis TaxID=1785913 RepID=A0A9W6SGH1_9ACTN|nr:replication-relaxation family protein [Actinorhabdospora filicis]GLZ76709.1 hypothetical protein Afil01_15160 [Actinorhabdospora filicis]